MSSILVQNIIENNRHNIFRLKATTTSVTIDKMFGKTLDESSIWKTRFEKSYDLVTTVVYGTNTILVAKDLEAHSVDIFSVNMCGAICTCDIDSVIHYSKVANEFFVKVRSSDGESIYDELGNLMSKSNNGEHIDIVFAGCEPAIEKTDIKTGDKSLWNLEGHLLR